MRGRRPVLRVCAAAAVAGLVALTTGCAHQDGAAPASSSSAAPSGSAGAASGYADMKKKVDAAESAAAAADRDASSTADK
ncbi:hypothetical protein AB0D11_14175 [Streptomyces monashensis]|uniref:hypothetical protein n=1 Tax=Streptomyces monashensis TaxID=1678012 RepID=UPI00340BD343